MKNGKSRVMTYAIIVGCAAFLATMAALATDAAPIEYMELDQDQSVRHNGVPSGRTWQVRCDRGERLGWPLQSARPGDTIMISGFCSESIIVKTDNLTLAGVDGAVIDGASGDSEAVVLIDGARNVTLQNLVVQNGADQGVIATRQAHGTFKNLTIRGNESTGLTIDRSHFDLENLTVEDNGGDGMDAFASSTVVVRGLISASQNGGAGLAANGKTFLELRGAEIIANNNVGSGVSIINDSRLQIFSFPEAQGSSITADGNGFAGIGLAGAELGVVGSEFFGSAANIIRSTNNLFGFFMPAGAILSPHATAKFVVEGNEVGFLMEDGASALIVGGLNATGNGAGVSAVGAGTLTFVSVPPNPSVLAGNGADIVLEFGTRVSVIGFEVESVFCDETVLSRGLRGCGVEGGGSE